MTKLLKQKITTFLWFDHQAEEAAKFYVSLFDDSKIEHVARYPEGAPAPAGSVMTVTFRLAGQQFIALNGGPYAKFNESVSLLVDCATQAENDRFWKKLGAGGTYQPCGWLKDKYGLSWQITPSRLLELVQDRDPATASRAMKSMMQMKKIDIAEIERAARGEPKKKPRATRARSAGARR